MALSKRLMFLLFFAVFAIFILIGVLIYINYMFYEKVAETIILLGELGVLVNG